MKLHIAILILLTGFCFNCLNVAESTATAPQAQGTMPWETAFLKAPPQEVIRASEGITLEKEEDVRILYREVSYKFDEQTRLTTCFRIVYKILSANGISYWSTVSQSWDPWYQEKPVIRARVCNLDGNAYFLRPENLVESGEKEDNVNLFSERRYLRAPLPNVTIGSVIEVEYILQEKSPYFKEGTVLYMDIRSRSPLYREKILVEVPVKLPFRYKVFEETSLKPEIKKYSNSICYVFSLENVPPEAEYENALATKEPFWPCIAMATGESWNKIALSYNYFIEEALKGEDFTPYLKELKAKDARLSAMNIVKWLNERVRYTGLELGKNSIVPAKPSQILARGFGDCKDKATLVTGMLRQMGYRADVALVDAGFGVDVNENLPGLGHFNHAIVFINEEGGIWIDPTAEYSREAYFPLPIQNRNALIINTLTNKLVKIPKMPAQANRVIRKKEFFLQNDGKAKVTEITLHYGAEEDYIRSQLSYLTKEKLLKNIDDYIRSKYGAGILEASEITDPADLNEPFRIQLKIKEVERAETKAYLAQVVINQAEIFSYLPECFLQKLEKDRVNNFVFFKPNEFELQYIIHPPLGFVPRKLPENEKLALGTLIMQKEFVVEDNNDVVITLHLNSGKDQITPTEFMSIYNDIGSFLKKQQLLIEFDHKGIILLKKGDYKESLAFFYSLVSEEPKNPLHRIRYAFALLQAGLGAKARQVVNEAIALSPESAEVYGAQGWILQFDILGRRFQTGYDRQGAYDAYKKALELDNKNIDYHINLALLLEHDKEGFRFGKGADLNEAIEHYKYVYKELKFKDVQSNLISALLYAENYAELQSLAREIEDNDLRSVITIVALVGEKGLDQGLAELDKINSIEKRRGVQLDVSDLLFRIRHYKEAAELLRDAARYSADAMQIDSKADIYQKLIRFEEIKFMEDNPESLVKNYLLAFINSGGNDFNSLKKYTSEVFYANGMDGKNPSCFQRQYNITKYGLITTELPRAVCLDLFFSLMKVNCDGNKEDGYRVIIKPPDGAKTGSDYYYLHNIKGKLKIVANQNFLSAIGKQIDDFLKENQKKKAEKWLNWYYENFAILTTDAQEVFPGRPFQKFWNPTTKDMKLAAAAIMAEGPFAKEAETVLLQSYAKAETEEKKHDIDYALHLVFLELNKYQEQKQVMERLYSVYPESEKIFTHYIVSLLTVKDYPRAEQIINKHLSADPDDKLAHSLLLRDYAYKLDFKALEEQMEKCLKLNAIGESEYNLVAWVGLFNSALEPKSLEYARTAMKLSAEREDYIIHTMATLYAEVGRCQEAWQLINKVLLTSGNNLPTSDDWYVFGRLAEQYGEIQEAINAYECVLPPGDKYNETISTYILAQKRLKLLKNQK
jgi:predicted Zn-dependent protease